jgi:5-methylcytosine-specific restriction endonuclease McrA
MVNTRKLTYKIKKEIATRNEWKCINTPANKYSILSSESEESKTHANVILYPTFECPLYKNNGNGIFTIDNNYEIDHRIELRHGGSDTIDNCFPLCKICHAEKSKRFRELGDKSVEHKISKKIKRKDVLPFCGINHKKRKVESQYEISELHEKRERFCNNIFNESDSVIDKELIKYLKEVDEENIKLISKNKSIY